jgi:hypothetical protein
MACLVALGVGFAGYYNNRVTGHALVMPHQEYTRQYESFGSFRWDTLRAPVVSRHAEFVAYDRWARGFFTPAATSIRRFATQLRVGLSFFFFDGWALLGCGILAGWALLRDRWLRLGLGVVALLGLGHLAVAFYEPHYSAPAFGLLGVVVTAAVAWCWQWRVRRWPVGRVVVLAAVIGFGLTQAHNWQTRLRLRPRVGSVGSRALVEAQLTGQGARHLVLVSYGPGHDVGNEWVYNRADVNGAPIVWARDMGPEDNRELLAYYSDRKVWRLQVNRGADRPELTLLRGPGGQ